MIDKLKALYRHIADLDSGSDDANTILWAINQIESSRQPAPELYNNPPETLQSDNKCEWCNATGVLSRWTGEGWDDESCPECSGATEVNDRECLAVWMTEHGFTTGHGDTVADLLKELSWQVEDLRQLAADEENLIDKMADGVIINNQTGTYTYHAPANELRLLTAYLPTDDSFADAIGPYLRQPRSKDEVIRDMAEAIRELHRNSHAMSSETFLQLVAKAAYEAEHE